jgi:hypothetical protein
MAVSCPDLMPSDHNRNVGAAAGGENFFCDLLISRSKDRSLRQLLQ